MPEWLTDYLIPVVSAVSGFLVSFFAWLTARFATKKLREENRRLTTDLDKARRASVSCKCPKCGERVYLSELTFTLPDGSPDSNLDGEPD